MTKNNTTRRPQTSPNDTADSRLVYDFEVQDFEDRAWGDPCEYQEYENLNADLGVPSTEMVDA